MSFTTLIQSYKYNIHKKEKTIFTIPMEILSLSIFILNNFKSKNGIIFRAKTLKNMMIIDFILCPTKNFCYWFSLHNKEK